MFDFGDSDDGLTSMRGYNENNGLTRVANFNQNNRGNKNNLFDDFIESDCDVEYNDDSNVVRDGFSDITGSAHARGDVNSVLKDVGGAGVNAVREVGFGDEDDSSISDIINGSHGITFGSNNSLKFEGSAKIDCGNSNIEEICSNIYPTLEMRSEFNRETDLNSNEYMFENVYMTKACRDTDHFGEKDSHTSGTSDISNGDCFNGMTAGRDVTGQVCHGRNDGDSDFTVRKSDLKSGLGENPSGSDAKHRSHANADCTERRDIPKRNTSQDTPTEGNAAEKDSTSTAADSTLSGDLGERAKANVHSGNSQVNWKHVWSVVENLEKQIAFPNNSNLKFRSILRELSRIDANT